MRSNRSIPQATVIPVLAYPDVLQAVDWLCAAFGFTVRLSIGDHRAQLNAGEGGAVVVNQLKPGDTCDRGHAVMVRVADVNAHLQRATEHGAVVTAPPADYPYGERQYSCTDFAGHDWKFSQSIADVDPRDWGGTPGAL